MDENDRHSLGQDVRATAAARGELGAEFEPALIDSLVERIDQAVEQRVQAQVGRQPELLPRRRRSGGYPVALSYVSLGTGIPITAIAGGTAGLGGIALAWLGIVGVNVAAALGTRGPDDD
ncbi:hypothetical protein [Solicola sp. PLA-1-18]|uniref:hypothetical protein n=1 Tax=Solicola sp. PLA-1-18 TaxID=3380532 RepID=UPI003B7A121E